NGLEEAFMVNHMAPFILSAMLFPLLRANAPARIINVNAGLYVFGRFDLNRTPMGADFSPLRTYMNTKLCNVLFTRRFARAIQDSGVTINANHPGVIRTGLGESGLSGRIIHRTIKRFWKSPEAGAAAPVWLATDPQLENTNGLFFDLKQERPYAANARNEILIDSLYEYSWIESNLSDFYI
ncbi:MAG: hypothetical protein KDK34_23820, partial [Leptospiraceae bacterium]|nr:hypothetical protein [Leptospiraceae bacterium]